MGEVMIRYYYRVSEFFTTFSLDEVGNGPLRNDFVFESENVLSARMEAFIFYRERWKGILEKGQYFLPFAAPEDFVPGENAAFSLTLEFVIVDDSGNSEEYILEGEDDDTKEEAYEIEFVILQELGYLGINFSAN
jgi:hypothetical protein